MNKFTNICRTCMKTCNESLISLFSTQICLSKSMQLTEILWECASIQITSDDDLPKLICEKCADQLKIGYEFKLMCHNTERELLKLIGKEFENNIKNENDIKEDSTTLEIGIDIKNEQIGALFGNDEFTNDSDNQSDWLINDIKTEQKQIVPRKKLQKNNAKRKKLKRFKKGAKCDKCSKVFHKKSDFQTHSCEKIYSCQVCSESFTAKSYLTKHLKKHSENNDNLDDNSSNISQEKEEQTEDIHPDLEYVRNIPLEQFKKGIKCSKCPRTLFRRSDMEIHVIRHIGIKKFPCQLCSKSFTVFSDLTRHRKTVHATILYGFKDNDGEDKDNSQENKSAINPFNCKMCSRTFWRKSDHDLHVKRHLGIKKFKCDFCSKMFVTRYDLKKHLRTHGDLSGFHCKYCYRSFDKSEQLDEHMDEHANDVCHVCQQCGKQFRRSGNLKLHMTVHTGETPHLCTVCGRTFRLSSNLKVHMRIHNGEKPYACKTCGKAFAQSAALRVHLPTHSDEKRYVCQTCGKAYNRQNALYAHTRRHLGVRNFPCTMCDKRFYNGTLLRKHLVIHTGEKNFKCESCGKAFNRADHLRVHNKTHIEEQSFNCTVCGQNFVQKQFLINHMTSHQLQ